MHHQLGTIVVSGEWVLQNRICRSQRCVSQSEKNVREFFYETIVRQTESHFCVLCASDLATLPQLLTAAL